MRIRKSLFASLSIMSMATPGAASTLKRMSLTDLAGAAQAIAQVRCISDEARWQSGEIWTFTVFHVQQVWKGDLPRQITVRMLGGRTANLTSIVPGAPRFYPGENAVLFLERTRSGDYSITSWAAGTFRIRRGGNDATVLVTQDTADYESSPASPQAPAIRDVPVDSFRKLIMAAVKVSGRAHR